MGSRIVRTVYVTERIRTKTGWITRRKPVRIVITRQP